MEMQKVTSSNLAKIGFDSLQNILAIEFLSGRLYEYRSVPVHVYHGLQNARSKGTFFQLNIRDKFRTRRLK